MIEGKLAEMSRDPCAVQVEVIEGESGRVTINLHDSHGAFMEADCSTSDNRREGKRVISRDQDDEDKVLSESSVNEDAAVLLAQVQDQNRQLHILNDELTTQVSTLKVEVCELTDKLRRETERLNEVWRVSCDQVSSFDETIVAKEEKIGRLRARIAEIEASLLSVCA